MHEPATADAPSEPRGESRDAAPVGSASETDALVEYLRARDVTCPLCGYNLRGLEQPRCPECGRELVLSVGLTEPFLKAWITLAVALFLPAGIGLLFGVMVAFKGFPGDEPRIAAIILFFMAHVPLAGAAVWWRRPFLKLSPRAQWRWSAAGTAFLLFLSQVR
jgi:hypothetical protein